MTQTSGAGYDLGKGAHRCTHPRVSAINMATLL